MLNNLNDNEKKGLAILATFADDQSPIRTNKKNFNPFSQKPSAPFDKFYKKYNKKKIKRYFNSLNIKVKPTINVMMTFQEASSQIEAQQVFRKTTEL